MTKKKQKKMYCDMTEAKFRQFIINLLRKGTYKWKPRTEAKNLRKVGPATFKCDRCSRWIYEGSKTLDKLFKTFEVPNGIELIKGKINLHHDPPVIDPNTGFTTFDSYIYRMYCPIDNFKVLCEECHDKEHEKNGKKKN